MTIKESDISLAKFLEFFAPVSIPETGKFSMPDGEFIISAALLRLIREIEKRK